MTKHLSAFFSHRASRAIGAVFIGQGMVFGVWASMIPSVKEKFGLDEAQLGLLLLGLPIGSTSMNPLSSLLIRRIGAVRGALWARSFCGLVFLLPFLAPSVWLMAAGMVALGATFSATNVTMNTCASLVETHEGARIMSTCHGLWSTGAMCGSALGSLALSLGMSPLQTVVIVGLGLSGSSLLLRGPLFEVPEPKWTLEDGPKRGFGFPTPALWLLISISLCTNFTEGAMADWTAVYMREVVGAPTYLLGWGFSAYAFCMASGRFFGDALLLSYPPGRILRLGGLVAAAGISLALAAPYPLTTMLGFALVGAGVSLGAPILYGEAAKSPGMAPGAGLATMNTFAMLGFLCGPTVIGLAAKAFTLPLALGLLVVAGLFWSWRAGRLGAA
jgi:predicted MFS family arabinose efflux permease